MAQETPPDINTNSVVVFNESGIAIPTLPNCINQSNENLVSIYPNADVSSNTPDGQWSAILAKQNFDNAGVLAQIVNSFNPATAIGQQLDDVCSITNITRSPETFTLQHIQVVITSPCNLPGLNAPNGVAFTIADTLGTNYILTATQNGLLPGTYTFLFRAQDAGAIQSTTNSINQIITTIVGVASVNNPTSPVLVGTKGETDPELRIRQQLSPASASNGYLNGAYGYLASIVGVGKAKSGKPLIYINNNTTKATNIYGTPGNTIWTIILGGSDEDIANVLAGRISAGCGFRGGTVVLLKDPQGLPLYIRFDRPTPQIAYLKLTLSNINQATVDANIEQRIKNYLVQNGIFEIGESLSQGLVTELVNEAIDLYAPNQLTSNSCTLSLDGITYSGRINPSNINIQFVFSDTGIDITIV